MKNNLLAILLIVSISSASGQNDSLVMKRVSNKLYYSNSFIVGGLFGEDGSGNTFSGAMNHGIRYGRLATGLGISFDSYTEWRSVPVYGYLSFDLLPIQNNALFIFASGGYSHSWYGLEVQPGSTSYDAKGGGYFNSMLGYRIKANQYRIYVGCGYKFQRINYRYASIWWWDTTIPAPSTSVEMDLNRFTVQIGFGWN